jgi:TonB family protein
MISDVTGEGGPPYLLKSKKPIVSPDMARTTGTKPLVVRVVIGRQGKVIEAASLNENENNASLSRAALAAIESWEFSPVRGRDEKVWTRYFSFRVTE